MHCFRLRVGAGLELVTQFSLHADQRRTAMMPDGSDGVNMKFQILFETTGVSVALAAAMAS